MLVFFKSLHIIGFVSWFAGLFYLGRLLIYLKEAQSLTASERNILSKQFNLMGKRVQYAIIYPAMVITLFAGFTLAYYVSAFYQNWFQVKLITLLAMLIYTYYTNKLRIMFLTNDFKDWTSLKLRHWNEVATLFLVWIVFLAGFKDQFFTAKVILPLVIFSIFIFWSVNRINRR